MGKGLHESEANRGFESERGREGGIKLIIYIYIYIHIFIIIYIYIYIYTTI